MYIFFKNRPIIINTPNAPDIGYIKFTNAEKGILLPIKATTEHKNAIMLNFHVPSFAKLLHTLHNNGTAVVYIPAISINENKIPTIGPMF